MKRSSSKISSTPDKLRDFVYNAAFFGNLPFFGAFALLTFEESTCHYHTAQNATPNTPTKIRHVHLPGMCLRMERRRTCTGSDELIVKDANGNLLADGDSVPSLKI